MPGILPLKTIQLSSSSQSRIAQACDRCRSKKIRCDGIQPNCTPCQAVNFDCKTSDKLSRKAYPKGYTSSLEERVRELEGEIRQLKDLLDEKDEKIDILSKMRQTSAAPVGSPTPPASTPSDHGREDTFRVHQTVRMHGKESSSQYFVGDSSSRAFVGE
jgi:Fungal Zn(2)-Cys(6) binuclear cluster domain